MINRSDPRPVVRQCEVLNLSRSSVYPVPQPVSEGDLALMRRIDELHLNHPFALTTYQFSAKRHESSLTEIRRG